ncbi:hypothetical protein [Candidatus Reidiella endopervernicosa]|uniref:Chemotaxis methyl-accepting receptor HlyB-like 4HB MCP domain-containing protein n=1 Tax=Candidatus Reidiella endopervernicosa TaxID=2738883 RepID=A0A6N0HYB3_9GAMM|nr:hypothetical protein [Candidatus Reidiella endopervernicosa]QKQ27329.1 hypothetical protein HUE57_14320 [Candidatus Reidiella endopervernicosa]
MLNSIKKKIIVSNGALLVILLLVLIFALIQLKSNQQLLAQEEENVTILTEIADIEEHFLEFRIAATEFALLLQNSSKQKRDDDYKQLRTIFSESVHPEIAAETATLENYYSQIEKAATAFINDDKMEGGLLLNTSIATADQILTVLKNQYGEHKSEVDVITGEIHESNSAVTFSLYALLVAMVVAGIGISLFLANMISSGLIKLQRTVEEIEQTGESLFCESLFWASKPKQTAKT